MVHAGMALAFVRYSRDYVQDEAAARAARLGVHAHGCSPPWEWRAAAGSIDQPPRRCSIVVGCEKRLDKAEKAMFDKSVDAVKGLVEVVKAMKA